MAPSAVVLGDVKLEKNASVWFQSVLRYEIRLRVRMSFLMLASCIDAA